MHYFKKKQKWKRTAAMIHMETGSLKPLIVAIAMQKSPSITPVTTMRNFPWMPAHSLTGTATLRKPPWWQMSWRIVKIIWISMAELLPTNNRTFTTLSKPAITTSKWKVFLTLLIKPPPCNVQSLEWKQINLNFWRWREKIKWKSTSFSPSLAATANVRWGWRKLRRRWWKW